MIGSLSWLSDVWRHVPSRFSAQMIASLTRPVDCAQSCAHSLHRSVAQVRQHHCQQGSEVFDNSQQRAMLNNRCARVLNLAKVRRFLA